MADDTATKLTPDVIQWAVSTMDGEVRSVLTPALARAGEALLTGQTMMNAIGCIVGLMQEDDQPGQNFALLEALQACLEKAYAVVIPAQEEANDLARAMEEACHG